MEEISYTGLVARMMESLRSQTGNGKTTQRPARARSCYHLSPRWRAKWKRYFQGPGGSVNGQELEPQGNPATARQGPKQNKRSSKNPISPFLQSPPPPPRQRLPPAKPSPRPADPKVWEMLPAGVSPLTGWPGKGKRWI